jgi:hypothetical protein
MNGVLLLLMLIFKELCYMTNFDDNPNSDVGVSADSVLAALETLGNFVKTAGGQSSTLNATDNQHKTDVNVPEVLTGLNALTQERAAVFAKAMDAITIQTANQNQFYNSVLNEMMIDHRDQNHTKQALATTFPFVVAGDAAEESANDTDK